MLTPSVDTYQSGYHLGRCQHWVSTLGVNTYLKEGAGWVTLVTESFIPFHILSHPSSPLHSNRPRWSKCLTFVARMYYFKAPVFAFNRCPRVLIRCFPTQVRFLLPRQSHSLSAVDPRFYIYALTILLPFDCAFHH